MNRFLYTSLIFLSLPFALVRTLLRDTKSPSWKRKLKNQLGFGLSDSSNVIWLHCVSVGEFNASKPLIEKLFIEFPLHKVVITTTTITGSNAVLAHYKNQVTHYFFPFDVYFSINLFVKKIKPVVCILLETEIWPNLIKKINDDGIPVALINARLSDRSFKKYNKYSAKLVSSSLKKLSIICSQNENSSKRCLSLGALKQNVYTTGSIKFDVKEPVNLKSVQEINSIVGRRKVVAFASTRDGEERKIIESFLALKNKLNALLLIIPRHPERFNLVFDIAKASGLKVSKRSSGKPCERDTDILIGDSMGEMISYFSISDIAFIGGSLTNDGGQNMLEAASLSKPIIFGPSVFNFEEISKKLIDDGSAIPVKSADELMIEISDLLSNDTKRRIFGENAGATFGKNCGATDKVINAITPYIKSV